MISKFKKGSDDYLTEVADEIIGRLVHEKEHLFKAYNYYQGFRDRYQFEHLEQNYDVGNPTSVKFTPLIRKHVDAIVGEYLSTKIQPKISCKDKRTLTNIMRDKQLEIANRITNYISKLLNNAAYNALFGKPQQNQDQSQDPIIEKELQDIRDSVNMSFISNYEIAAQDIIQYILQSRKIDFKTKIQQLVLDLLIAGENYYRVIPTPSKTNFQIEVCDPLNSFVFRNPQSKYMKDGTMSVVRKWFTREEIEIKYGKELSDDDIDSLESFSGYTNDDERLTWISALNSRGCTRITGILGGTEVTNYFNDSYDHYDIELVPVYEVEWIDYDEKKEKGVLYKVTRIGGDIYILHGEDEYTTRSYDSPDEVRLSLNGMIYTTRTGVPYSLMLATADLQDLYDLTLFQKDNLIAQSGVKGAIVNMSELPSWMGEKPEERVLKYLGYRKMGLALIDPSQDGEKQPNTIYGGFDDTLNVNSIQGFQISLQMIEDIASSITGVFRERLGGIEARDAVSNVEVGMQQSYIITKQYYQAMDVLVSEMITDSLDMAKKVYKKGFTGEIILGNRKEIFTLLPEHYTFTDYDIHLADSAEIIKEQDLIRQLCVQYMQSSVMDPEILFIISTSKSLTEMKELGLKAIREKKIENNQLAQLQQQLQEAQANMEQMQKQLQASTKKIQQLDERRLNIEEQDNRVKQSIEWFKVKSAAEAKDKELDLIKDRNKLEALQLVDENPNNDEILDQKR